MIDFTITKAKIDCDTFLTSPAGADIKLRLEETEVVANKAMFEIRDENPSDEPKLTAPKNVPFKLKDTVDAVKTMVGVGELVLKVKSLLP